MTIQTVAVQDSAEGGGITFQLAAQSANSDEFDNDGDTILIIHNTSGSNRTATLTAANIATTKGNFGDLDKADATEFIEANSVDIMGPFPMDAFNDSAGKIQLDFNGSNEIYLAAVRIKQVKD